MKKPLMAILLALSATTLMAQRRDYSKLSAFVRQIAAQRPADKMSKAQSLNGGPTLTAFVKTDGGDAERLLRDNGCRTLARFGSISIAAIPVGRIASLTALPQVLRIEASRTCSAQMDSVALQVDALPAYAGTGLPQAYTGRGVVMGIQDIGFDLTHPTFYSRDLSQYRVKALWDQLAPQDGDSTLYVGKSYTTREQLLQLGHSRDGIDQSHGTHTAGIAAGSGYDSPYRGMAWESDLCLVANASSEDLPLIDSADVYKYTSATDALGFKYIFDYAASQGKPCVISFSEGSHQDLRGDDNLYYEVLDSLVGPGRVIVSSAGNEGEQKGYFRKPAGAESDGAFIVGWGNRATFSMKATAPFAVRIVAYGAHNDTLLVSTADVLNSADSTMSDTVSTPLGIFSYRIGGWDSPYNPAEQAYEMEIATDGQLGSTVPVSIELVGREADVEWFRNYGSLTTNPLNPSLQAGEYTHTVLSPSTAPAVICVGATSYRTHWTNWLGDVMWADSGTGGIRSRYSAVGPTFDGRMKPDVVAPGTNIVSSFSSYYITAHPDADNISSGVAHFDFNGRTYAWQSDAGTSMSSPVVGGAIALWLEANPTLTPDDCRRIFAKTCTHYDTTLTYPNIYYGYGQIDVYRGLLEALNLPTLIPDLPTAQPSSATIRPTAEGLSISFSRPLVSPATIAFYSVAGQLLRTETIQPGNTHYIIGVGGMPHGVFAVRLSSKEAGCNGSTLIRM